MVAGDSDPVLGTQAMSRILRCSPRTVSKLIDSKQLPGFRVPGSKTRRVLRSELVRFCEAANLPAVIVAAAQRAKADDDADPDLDAGGVSERGVVEDQPLGCAATFLPGGVAAL